MCYGGVNMKYNFDEKIDRKNNHSAKWSEMKKNYGSDDLWPMWIADMDIKTAPAITDALVKKAQEGIFGYVYRPETYYGSAVDWCKRRFDWKIKADELIHTLGVIPALTVAVRLFTEKKDKIMIQTPVYYPFYNVIKQNDRELVTNPLVKGKDGYYTMDFEDMEEKLSDPQLKVFILCSPHNPVGRVWKKEELEKIGELCLKYNVRIYADEIWRDLVYPNHKHIAIASLSKEIQNITVTFFSASKTFNLAGLQASYVHFPRKEEFEKYDYELGVLDIKRNSPFNLVAGQVAFKQDEWVDSLVVHLRDNLDYLLEFMTKELPKVKISRPEATYLVWMDFTEYGLTKEELSNVMKEKGKIALDDGYWFGVEGEGYERINIACPGYMLEEGLDRIKKAVSHL